MTQACSRTSGPTVRLYLADRWRGMVALSGLSLVLMLGCGFTPTRALGIPGAASRTPDLSLPLQVADQNLALLYLDKKHPPRGQWENWSKEEMDAELATVTAETRTHFQPILEVLAQAVPSARDLDATGRVGFLFDPVGASDEALDARLSSLSAVPYWRRGHSLSGRYLCRGLLPSRHRRRSRHTEGVSDGTAA